MIVVIGLWTFLRAWLLGSTTIALENLARRHRPNWHQMQTRYLDRLAEAGVRPDQIDMVMCTHLHVDHVGWNTRLDNGRWVPTFPNARYVWHRGDYDKYKDADPAKEPNNRAAFDDSVRPIVEAGLAGMVTGAHTLDENLSLEPAPGHTPGIVSITLALAWRACAVLRRHRSSCDPAVSSGVEQLRLPRCGWRLQEPPSGARAVSRRRCTADARPLRCAVRVPRRRPGGRVLPTVGVSMVIL